MRFLGSDFEMFQGSGSRHSGRISDRKLDRCAAWVVGGQQECSDSDDEDCMKKLSLIQIQLGELAVELVIDDE
jgi:hypothetical protein